jgi:hypothetical protein
MTLRALILTAAASLGAAACDDDPAPGPPVVCEEHRPMTGRAGASLQCGPTLDFTPVNSYQGDLAAAQEREEAVVLINGSCTGTLVAAAAGPVVLTAGHCTEPGARAVIAFNIEDAPDGDRLVTEATVFEHAIDPDYALLRLDALPAVTPTSLTSQPTDLLAIIQHPRGRPKVVAEGSFLDSCGGLVYYTDLDTLVGSSGAGILNRQGHLVGIHTDGDCGTDGSGTNLGWTAAVIVDASPYLEAVDIAHR